MWLSGFFKRRKVAKEIAFIRKQLSLLEEMEGRLLREDDKDSETVKIQLDAYRKVRNLLRAELNLLEGVVTADHGGSGK